MRSGKVFEHLAPRYRAPPRLLPLTYVEGIRLDYLHHDMDSQLRK